MDIISLPIQGDFVNTHSRYRLVVLATQRARQLMEGDKPTLLTRYTKPTTIAVAEILSYEVRRNSKITRGRYLVMNPIPTLPPLEGAG
ncbi:MAG: DNA-directed RNA polymerase subunit omega [Nitrospirae bacterium]|nr:DNA-directed RNA polymerase subunit omega [Candidatus Troglogloeales bacterium]